MNMPTATRLMLLHGTTHLPLETAAKEYLGISADVARRKANHQSLPWPVLNTGEGKKAAKFVSITAIANWLDTIEKQAQDDWNKVHS